MSDSCKRAVVSGRVQGVFFRNWTVETANALGVSGWVRNRKDGTVEALLCGEPGTLAQMIEKMKSGPERANVTDIAVSDADISAVKGFTKRPTV
ncbi:acylphosphatase [Pacificimonas sp. ICDLI1SI03]